MAGKAGEVGQQPRQEGIRMIFEEHFQRRTAVSVAQADASYGIRAEYPPNSTSWTGFHEAFKGEDGTELVIGEHSDVEITFAQEVECLRLEYYVVSDFLCDDLHMLFDAENQDHDLAAPTLPASTGLP
jgi:hypothetical protein